ncbi:hypothetical protein UlMin_025646 [Ulmus minor]
MDQTSGEDTDISESDLDEYTEVYYEELKNGNRIVKVSEETFTCPYCQSKKKRHYQYKELLQHASGVGESGKRGAKVKAEHLALAQYLEKDVAAEGGDVPANYDNDEKYVWPWIGIVVNIPTKLANNGKYVGESGSKLRDDLKKRGFNPIQVQTVWTSSGHLGTALVKFDKDWCGFSDAIRFEKVYEADHHGKREWYANSYDMKSGHYAWVAREDDYNLDNKVGNELRKIGDLKTISQIMEEAARKQDKLVNNLTNIIEEKSQHLYEMEMKYSASTITLNNLMEEKDRLQRVFDEEIKKVQLKERDMLLRILNDHKQVKSNLEAERRKLELREKELEKREAENESERKKLAEEIEKNAIKNSLQLAAVEQEKADENVLKLVEDHQRQKEDFHRTILQQEENLGKKQALELEVEQLRGTVNVMRHMGGDNAEGIKIMEATLTKLKEKEEELENCEDMYQALITAHFKSNEEQQKARKVLIDHFKDITSSTHIGVKRMGELDSKPFFEAMKRKYKGEEAERKAVEICSLWEEHLKDPAWHPFKVIEVGGEHKV